MDTLGRVCLWICPVAIVTAIAVVIYAMLKRIMAPVQAAYLIVVLTLFVLCFTLFLYGLLKDGNLKFERNWGGLGGGLSGWSLSPTLTFLLLSIGLLALLVVTTGTGMPKTDVRERYRAALNFAAQKGIQFNMAEIVGGKLILKGTAPSATEVNAFWDQVKLANPIYDDLEAQLTVRTPQAPTVGGSAASSAGAPSTGAPASHSTRTPVK